LKELLVYKGDKFSKHKVIILSQLFGFMAKLKVGIIGIGNIGKYHAREFFLAGCEINSILATTKEKAEEKRKLLEGEFGIKTKSFYQLEEFLAENLDVVSICTPPETHYNLTKRCLEAGANVLCEKPFVETVDKAKELFNIAKKKGLVLSVNMQWPSILTKIKERVDLGKIESFYGAMEPGLKGVKMLEDHLPHLNSLLIGIFGDGKVEEIEFPERGNEKIVVTFVYDTKRGRKKIKYESKYKKDRPRAVRFSFGNVELVRRIGKNYGQKFFLVGNNKEEEIYLEDPLKASIKRFVNAVKHKSAPLISEKEVIKNLEIQEKIIAHY
jgi:predicted dehydrogenase